MKSGVSAALVALVCAVPFCGEAQAQEAVNASSAAPPQTAPPSVPAFRTSVVVTAERGVDDRDSLPVSTSVMTREQLDQRPAATLADAVQMLPGLQILFTDASGLLPVSIARGFFGAGEAEYVKVLVDGVPLNDVESGLVDWRRVPALAVERIEALRGPASAVYGDTALGGVVQVFTAAPTARAVRISLDAGSFESTAVAGGFGQAFGGTAIQAQASYNRSGGFRAHSDVREGFGSLSAHRTGESRHWTARGSWNYLDREEPGALTGARLSIDREASDPLFQFDRETTRRGYGAFRYGSIAGPLTYGVLGYASGRTADRRRTLLLAPALGDRADRDIASGGLGASIENSLDTGVVGLPGHFRFGVDLSRGDLATTYRAVSNEGVAGDAVGSLDGYRWQSAGYASQSVNAGSRVVLHAGVRWDGLRDRVSDRGRLAHDAWSPRTGGMVAIGGGASVFAQWSRAFKAPTLDQLFDPRPFPDFRGGTLLISSPVLGPQRATNVEGGIRQSTARYRWEAVLYRMRVHDEIDFDPATFTYANIGRSRHDGAELEAALFARSRVSISANYSWTRVTPDGAAPARQLKNIPRHLVRPDVTLMLPADTTVHARYTRTVGAYADDENSVPLRNRSTVDVRVAKRFSRLTARLDLLNITDNTYEEVGYVLPDFRGGVVPFYYPAAGVAARAGLDFTF